MSEAITKLQPDRTLYVASFTPRSAIGAIHNATPTGFTISGRFNALNDNVILEWNRDNDFEHPDIRFLPDGDFPGLTLSYDYAHSGLADLASELFAYTDFPYLNVYAGSPESLYRVPLKNYATPVPGDSHDPASASVTLQGTLTESDAVSVLFFGEAYWHTVTAADTFDSVVADLASQINGSSATMTASSSGPALALTTRRKGNDANLIRGYTVAVGHPTQATGDVQIGGTATAGDTASATITPVGSPAFTSSYTAVAGDSTSSVAQGLANAINSNPGNGSNGVTAFWSGSTITLAAKQLGSSGNSITYVASATGTLTASPTATTNLSGGVDETTPTESWSDATFHCAGGHSPSWHVVLPFASLVDVNGTPVPASSIRKLQWTFSPPLPDSSPFSFEEMTATFSNWTVSGAGLALKRGYPRLRFEDDGSEMKLSGSWTPQSGQYSKGGYSSSAIAGAYAELAYTLSYVHDLYLGTLRDTWSGIINVSVDGGPAAPLDLYSGPYQAYRARVRLASGLTPGAHTVRATVSGAKNPASNGWNFNFDFFEAAVPSDWEAPAQVYTDVGFATDFDTAHALALSPQRLAWGMHSLGIRGEVNHFVGIGQFAERLREDGSFPLRTYTFGGTTTPNDQIVLHFGDSSIGHFVQKGDTHATIARALAFKVNQIFTGIWASYTGSTLTVTVRVPSYSFTTSEEVLGAGTETITTSGTLTGGAEGTWRVDPNRSPKLNLATRRWHQDFASALAARGMTAIYAFSTELTDPPAPFAQRYPDGAEVLTGNPSTQTTFRPETLDYWKAVYLETAQLMNAAGATPALQFGEVQWWYFPNVAGMTYYDSYTTAQFQSQYGRPLHVFLTNNDDPNTWPEDSTFLRGQLQSHVDAIKAYVLASYPGAKFEILWPMDANDPPARRLNYVVNLPANWTPANFDTFKCEAFGYTGTDHDMTKAVTAIRFPMDQQGFPASRARHMVGVFGWPWPWERVLIHARRAAIVLTNFWAYDQFCFFALDLPLATEARRAQFVG